MINHTPNGMRLMKLMQNADKTFFTTFTLTFNSIFSDVIYAQNESAQVLVPLLSPSEGKIEFWIEPFDSMCKANLSYVFLSIIK